MYLVSLNTLVFMNILLYNIDPGFIAFISSNANKREKFNNEKTFTNLSYYPFLKQRREEEVFPSKMQNGMKYFIDN